MRIFKFLIYILCFTFLLNGCAKEAQVYKTAKNRISTGRDRLYQNKLNEAIEEFEAAASSEPKNFEAHYELGAAYYKNRDFKKAKDSLKIASGLNSKDPKIHNLLGLILQKEGLFEDAKRSFQEALRLNKRFEEPRLNLLNIDRAKDEYFVYRFASDFIYGLSREYSNGNNSFLRGVNESRAVKNEGGNIMRYDVNSDVYLAKEYFEKCSKILEKTVEGVYAKPLLDIAERFSQALQQRQEAVDLRVEGYMMSASYSGEFERADAKVRIADTYYVDAAKRLETLMQDDAPLFDEKDFSNLKHLINYYSQEKKNGMGALN